MVKKDSYPSFATYVDGEGTQTRFARSPSRFREIPAYGEDKSYY
jgi:hypothetical protein